MYTVIKKFFYATAGERKNSVNEMIAQLCDLYQLGHAQGSLMPVSGGLLHRMWQLTTDRGMFAVKELNPRVITTEQDKKRLVACEKIAVRMRQYEIPTVTALQSGQGVLTQIKDKYFIVYPWKTGVVLTPAEITPEHAYKIGAMLAKIQQATEVVDDGLIISHRDLDAKNVIWQDDLSFFIIDWEYAGPVNPGVDLLGVALNWSGQTECDADETKFKAVIAGFRSVLPLPEVSNAAIDIYLAYCVEWLNLNMRRSLEEPENRDLANNEVLKTSAALSSIDKNRDKILQWLQ